MASHLKQNAETFVRSYAALFSSPDACSSEKVGALAANIGKHYRDGMTMFTNGQISRFETQSQAAHLIETEMRNNISTNLGTKLILDKIEKIEPYSETSALCWLTWTFHPQAGSEFEGRTWTFTNIYAFRDRTDEADEGWEFVVRDQEVNEMRKVTGRTFES